MRFSQLDSRPVDASVYASPGLHGTQRKTRGQDGSLLHSLAVVARLTVVRCNERFSLSEEKAAALEARKNGWIGVAAGIDFMTLAMGRECQIAGRNRAGARRACEKM
jgi:hypothetical protein